MPRNKPTEGESKTVILNESDSALDAFCMSRGTSIVFIDEQLAALPEDNVNKRELMRLRARVEDAHRRGAYELLDGWLHALIIGLKAACHTIPIAVFGNPFKKNAERNATKSRKKLSPLRKAIARELNQCSGLKPREVWARIKSRAPDSWEFIESGERREWYVWIDGHPKTHYGTFSDICKQERDKLQA